MLKLDRTLTKKKASNLITRLYKTIHEMDDRDIQRFITYCYLKDREDTAILTLRYLQEKQQPEDIGPEGTYNGNNASTGSGRRVIRSTKSFS